MSYRETDHLRVLIANERKDRLKIVASIVASLGHEVIAREIDIELIGPSPPGSVRTSRWSGSARAREGNPHGAALGRRVRRLRHAARTGALDESKLADIANAVVDGHLLLPKRPAAPAVDEL